MSTLPPTLPHPSPDSPDTTPAVTATPVKRPRWQAAVQAAGVAVACAGLGFAALRLARIDDTSALLWWPAGLALGALLRWGRGLWPAAFIGLLAAHAAAGFHIGGALLLAASGTLGPWFAAGWLGRRRFQASAPGIRDARLLVSAMAASALWMAAAQLLWWSWTDDASMSALAVGVVAWMGSMVGGLLGTLPWLAAREPAATRRTPWERWEMGVPGAAALSVAVLGCAFALLRAHPPLSAAQTSLLFVPPVLLAWLAARGAGRWASSVLFLLGVGAMLSLGSGGGPLAGTGRDPGHALLILWAYLLACGMLLLGVQAGIGELRRIKNRLQLALDAADVGMADWDLRTGRCYTSPRWQALLGPAERHALPPQAAWLEQVHADDRSRERAALARLADPRNESYRHDLRLRTPAGWGWFHAQVLVGERGDGDVPRRLVVTLADIGERRANEERQRLSARLFQHLHEGLLITDADLRVLDVNPTYSQIMGVSRHELLGTIPPLLAAARAGTPGHDAAAAARHGSMWASLRATGTWRGEVVERRRNGDPCALQVTISAVLGPDSQPRYHVLVISDITDQHLQRQRLERQALFDELTRLPNRARLAQMLADAMAAADREGNLLAVCYLDLDHFKPVNDRFGHAAGDRLLVELAHRLRGALRSNAAWSDAAARLGGDEFVLLLRAGTLDEARLAVERVLRVISQPYAIEPGADPVTITASVGATVYPLDRSDADTLLRHADHAMYGAKQSGRNGYSFFDPEHSRRTEERVMAIGRIQEALDSHELELYYQPKVDMRQGAVLGMEALLRWNHPEHGVIPPAQFLPLIEHTGLSARVGDWVLDQALEQLARWRRMGFDLSVSVNVSARHLQEPDFAQRLAELLARHADPLGERLELEVLETAALADIDYTSALLERCRRLGVRFSLDDFGTGYSTLTYLKRLPVDVLKIDRSFVRNMLDDRQDLAIVEGVIGLARTFGCSVVAEGVEMPAQARLLIDMGCDIGQGHGIASPMRAGEVPRWTREYRGPFALGAAPSDGSPPPQVA
ncbi:EAL domain-containing protein [Aquincola sp. MAHUQ-54]|uniref:EAL domain-containing protein n=1 Tax=Aquincola agrisoli TaxID=3119538 RepID=A0AAW9Q860_9BURK